GQGLNEIVDAARDVPVRQVSRQHLDNLSGGVVHQGVVLEAEPLPIQRTETWVRKNFGPDAIVVVLDGVEDPHNFGAIVRSAAACGAAGVVYGRDRAAP